MIFVIGLGEVLLMTPRLAFGEQGSAKLSSVAGRLNEPSLLARGKTRVYHGANLTAVSLAVGGIGAGCIQINGKAERHIWQIFNNMTQTLIPHSFFAVRVKTEAGQPVVRAMQTIAVGPFEAMKSLIFRGEYPFGWFDFEDAELPIAVNMETFNPLIPLNAKDSAIPCAIFNLTANNTSDKPVEVSFLAAQQNTVGFNPKGFTPQIDPTIKGRSSETYGRNKNRVLKQKGVTILHMTADINKDARGYGDMALVVLEEKTEAVASWESLDVLRKDWLQDGLLSGDKDAGPSPPGQTLDGALAVSFTLKPGQSRTVTFVLTWYFPNALHGYGVPDKWSAKGNMYANWWSDALDVAHYLTQHLSELTRLTRLYHETFYASNLPHWLLDRISSQVAVLRSKTCFWAKDGYFGGWEGCNKNGGCCDGNCTHVWHYAQAHARLFPSIARQMRRQSFAYQSDDGKFPRRQPRWKYAFDGQCGEILAAYREHLTSVNREWLDKNWPKIRKAMEYTINRWDRDDDGILAGPQANTLDGELGGSTSWLGTLYLAALQATQKMADMQGDIALAGRCRRICFSGASKQNQTLWNGEYYIQIPDPQPRQDYVTGCHIDQLLGQWWANQLGLETRYPPDRIRSAMKSLLRYNFQPNFHRIKQRYVDPNDAGMQMITWPKGPRPEKSMGYSNEVMTGFEYAAAATMVQHDMLKEGFMVTRAIYDRYDGRLRKGVSAWGYNGNPFGDDECGKFYARAMSVWSMLLACQGFIYDGPAGIIGFKPVWKPQHHISLFTVAEGWGLFSQKRYGNRQRDCIELTHGRLKVRRLVFELPAGAKPANVSVEVAGQTIASDFSYADGRLAIQLLTPITINAGRTLSAVVQTAK